MYRRQYSDDDQDDIVDYHDDVDEIFGRPYAGRYRNDRRQTESENHFLKIIQSVTEEGKKGMTPEDEETLFSKINLHLIKPFIPLGILTLQRLAYIPETVSANRLNEMATIICMNIFNPLTDTDEDITAYADFSKAFAYLKATTHAGISVTFEQVLIQVFIDKLSKKFDYVQRLERLLWNRDIPREKKEKWLNKQIEEQERVFKVITHKSVRFLDKLYQLFPEIVFRVIDFLLKLRGEDRFDYLWALVDGVRLRGGYRDDTFEADVTNIYQMKSYYWNRNQQRFPAPVPVVGKELTPLFESINISTILSQDYITTNIRDVILHRIIDGNKKEHYPQDYIKYCIKDCLLSEGVKPEDDFEIEDEDNYECNLYTLRSKNLTPQSIGKSRPYGAIFWRGLRVKILTKKSENKPGHREKWALQNRNRRPAFKRIP